MAAMVRVDMRVALAAMVGGENLAAAGMGVVEVGVAIWEAQREMVVAVMVPAVMVQAEVGLGLPRSSEPR